MKTKFLIISNVIQNHIDRTNEMKLEDILVKRNKIFATIVKFSKKILISKHKTELQSYQNNLKKIK